MLGVGGSVVMIPAMTIIFGPAQQLYQGAAMIMNFFVSLPAAWQHRRKHAVLRSIVRVTIPYAIIGVIVGVWLSSGDWFHGHNEVYLSRLFGGFLFYVAVLQHLPPFCPAQASRRGRGNRLQDATLEDRFTGRFPPPV